MSAPGVVVAAGVAAVVVVIVVAASAALALALFAGPGRRLLRSPQKRPIRHAGSERILFPFTAHGLSSPALDAALRLAASERATLVPVFLARVALRLPLETALPRQSAVALALAEAIEQRAAYFGVSIENRIERGRTYRHALAQTFEHERFDRIVMAAAPVGAPGISGADVAWLLEHAPGEIIVLRPGQDGTRRPARPS